MGGGEVLSLAGMVRVDNGHRIRFRIADCWIAGSATTIGRDLRIAGFFQQRDAAGFDHFFAADRADAFAGFGLEADLVRAEVRGFRRCGGGWRRGSRPAWAARRGRRSRGSRCGSRPRSTFAAAAASISAESRLRLAASVLGNMRPMSGRAAAPSRASVTACSSTSASLWPTSAGRAAHRCRPAAAARPARCGASLRRFQSASCSWCDLLAWCEIGQSARIIPGGKNRDNASSGGELNRKRCGGEASCTSRRSVAKNSMATVDWLVRPARASRTSSCAPLWSTCANFDVGVGVVARHSTSTCGSRSNGGQKATYSVALRSPGGEFGDERAADGFVAVGGADSA